MAVAQNNPYTLARGKMLIRLEGSISWDDFAHVMDVKTNVTPEQLDHYSSRSKLKRRDKTVVKQVDLGGNMIVDVPLMKNIKRFFMSETETADVQTSGTWTGVSIDGPAEEGQWIKLPKRAVDPDTAIVLTSDPVGTTYVEDVDFQIDYEAGLLQRIAGGAMPDDAPLLITGAFLASTHTFIGSAEIAQQKVHFWFIGDPATGVKQDLRGYTLLIPSGDLSMIGEEWQQFTLDMKFEEHPDYSGPCEYVDKGVAADAGL